MRIGTKSLLGSCSSRLVSGLFTPWALVLHHPLSRLWSRTYSSPSTSPSPSAPNSFGESSCFFYIYYDMFLIICYADPLKKSPEIQVSSTSCGSLLDAKIGWHWEGFSSCRAWGGDSLVEVKDLFGRCGRDDTGILLSSSQRGFQAPYALSQLHKALKIYL